MRKLLFSLILTVLVTIGYSQSSLVGTATSSDYAIKKSSDSVWSEWTKRSTSFAFYKNQYRTTKIIISTPTSTITLICYAENKQKYDNGDFRYTIYCYVEGDSSAKTFNYKEFFRITDYNNATTPYSVAVLINKDPYDYCWQFDSFTKQ